MNHSKHSSCYDHPGEASIERTLECLLQVSLRFSGWFQSRLGRSLETARHNPGEFGTSAEGLRPLLTAIQIIEAQIVAAQAFRVRYLLPDSF